MMPVCQLRWLAGPWPFLLLFMHLVERFSDDVVFRPLNRRTSNYILWLRYRRKPGCCSGVYVCRVLAPGSSLLTSGRVVVVAPCRVCQTCQCGREDVVVCSCCLGPLLLQRAHKGFRVLDCSMLELLQRFQIALALLSLDLQERYRGPQRYGIWVLAL